MAHHPDCDMPHSENLSCIPDPARFCPTCGADIIGNDPHEPGCETGDTA